MQKKMFLLLFILFLFVGCAQKNEKDSIDLENLVEEKEEVNEVDDYVDSNPIKIGIYMYYNSYTNRERLDEYKTVWDKDIDICSLEIFYTTKDNIPPTNIKTLWNEYKNNYENIDNYRIGYHISFEKKNGEKIDKNILTPSDTEDIFEDLQLYLYDDVHQADGAWYSHVTNEEYNDNTILTSIKLTNSTNTSDIISDITLTVFTYDEDDFDSSNNYRGISKATIIIKRS